jgi:hypothetical protein
MSDKPQTLADAIGICLNISQRLLAEVRALHAMARIPGPAGERGEQGEAGIGMAGERGEAGEAGPPGRDARQWRHRRTHDPKQNYTEGDVVAHDGGSWLALTDEPGALPGDGWALLTVRGQRGKPGERGPPGPEGRGIRDLFVNETGETLVVVLSDGTQRSISLVTR